MSKFIRLYKSKRTPITGDIFTLAAYNYSEDNDIKDNTGNYITSVATGVENRDYFTEHGYTMGSPTSTTGYGATRHPLTYPRQMYIINDTSGGTDSDFVNELEIGDIIHFISSIKIISKFKFNFCNISRC